jgi:hypothetical protein
VDFQDFSILASEWMCEEPMADSYLKFNGTDQYVTVDNNAALNPDAGDFSISFWEKMSTFVANKSMLVKYVSNSSHYSIYTGFAAGSNIITFYTGTSGTDPSISTPVITIGQWQHIVFTVNRTTEEFNAYANGIASVAIDSTGMGAVSPAIALLFGKNTATNFGAFSLDDIRIYKGKALSQAEVTAIYNGGRGTKCTDAEIGTGWYSNCDDGADDVLTGFAVSSGTPSALDGALTGNVADNMWEAGGTLFDVASIFDRTRGTFPSGSEMFARTR